jgi:hypothetical protein
MVMPGSNQYPLIVPFQEVIPFGVLQPANADTRGMADCVGMGRLTLLCQYIVDDSTGVLLTIWLSPYSSSADVPGLESEWWPITIIAPREVEGCQYNLIKSEVATFTYCARAATLEAFTLDISLPSHAQRVQVLARELEIGGEEGYFGCYALLSLDSGGEFGWTIKTAAASLPT